jgi:hypothetical protein
MSEETPRKIIDIRDSDDDDDIKTPASVKTSKHASPFGAPKNSAERKANGPATTARIIHVLPTPVDTNANAENIISGLIMVVTGTNEFPFFQPHIQKDQRAFVTQHVTPWAFDFKPDGKNIIKNNKGFPRKALIWVQYPHNPTLTEEGCKTQYDLWMQFLIDTGYMTENQKPPLHEVDGYKVVKTWSEYLSEADIKLLYIKSHLSERYSNMKSFFRHSKNNLYSVYPVGKVPVNVIKEHNLRKYLLEDDADAYNAANPEPTATVIDVDANPSVGDVTADAPLPDDVAKKLPAAQNQVGPFGPPLNTGKRIVPRSLGTAMEEAERERVLKYGPSTEENLDNDTSEPSPKRTRAAKTRSSKGNDDK